MSEIFTLFLLARKMIAHTQALKTSLITFFMLENPILKKNISIITKYITWSTWSSSSSFFLIRNSTFCHPMSRFIQLDNGKRWMGIILNIVNAFGMFRIKEADPFSWIHFRIDGLVVIHFHLLGSTGWAMFVPCIHVDNAVTLAAAAAD